MGSLYPTDIVVGQRKERERERKKALCSFVYQRTPVEERAREKNISARYTLLYICILFVVVGTAAALIGSSI